MNAYNRLMNVYFLLAMGLFLGNGCLFEPAPPQASTGSSSETVIGKIVRPDGTPAPEIPVYIRSASSLIDTSAPLAKQMAQLELRVADSTTTDSNGVFRFDSMETGIYVIEAGIGDSLKLLIDPVTLDESSEPVELEADTLRPVGSIQGILQLAGTDRPDSAHVLVFGVNRFVQPDSNGVFLIEHLAAGKYDLRVIAEIPGYSAINLTDVQVKPGLLTRLDTLRLPHVAEPVEPDLASPLHLANAYMDLALNGSMEQAETLCLANQEIFSKLVKDTISEVVEYFHLTLSAGTYYVLFLPSSWEKDTVEKAEFVINKQRYTHSNGLTYVFDTINASGAMDTLHALRESHLQYHPHIRNAFKASFQTWNSVVKEQGGTFVRLDVDDPKLNGEYLYHTSQTPYLATGFIGLRHVDIVWRDRAGNLNSLRWADLIALTDDGWKMVLPAETKGKVLAFDTTGNDLPVVEKPVDEVIGLWKMIHYTKRGVEAGFVQFNRDSMKIVMGSTSDDFVFWAKGTYARGNEYTITHNPALIVGEFAYRDPNYLNAWIMTPAGQKDTLVDAPHILKEPLGNYTMDQINAADTIQVSKTLTVLDKETFTNTITLDSGSVMAIPGESGFKRIDEKAFFLVDIEGFRGTTSDSLELRALEGNSKGEPYRYGRITDYHDSTWAALKIEIEKSGIGMAKSATD